MSGVRGSEGGVTIGRIGPKDRRDEPIQIIIYFCRRASVETNHCEMEVAGWAAGVHAL